MITVDTASCTSGSISPPYSIANGATATFTGSTTGSSTLCTVKYHTGGSGCKFDVQVSNFGGFASANAYKGGAQCVRAGEGGEGIGKYYGDFVMR